MKSKSYILIVLFFLLNTPCTKAQQSSTTHLLTSDSLLKDFSILKGVMLNYHPGLYRYQDSLQVKQVLNDLEQELKSDLTLSEAYLQFSNFTARLKCGHTFCSFYNQNKAIKDSLFNRDDKVPFTFFLYDKRMFIEKNLSENAELVPGSEIISINNISMNLLIDTLIQYIKGDGGNNLKRLNDLNLSGLGEYEAFDIFYPLLYPSANKKLIVKFKKAQQETIYEAKLNTISRKERFQLIETRYGKQPSTYDDLWSFKIVDEKTAYLKIGTYVLNKMTIDWKGFIKNSFAEMKSKQIENLILDIRGNEGGFDEVNLVIGENLAKNQIDFPAFRELLRYEKVEDQYRPYLSTWDDSFYDRGDQLLKLDNGFYTWKKERGNKVVKKNKNAFQGKTYLLVDAANSSATFFLTAALQQGKIATIIGSPTGGNRKGTNGGQLFFLRLPYSKIEIDLPLIGYYPLMEQPDEGIVPDIVVPVSLNDILSGKDNVLETTLELIKNR